jgi:hydrogenase nickel incorporation protein HypA/HybF
MHEMGIALEVMNIAMSHLPDQGRGLKVIALRLKIGKLTAIIPETFRFCMEISTKDTPLEGANIIIEDVPLKVRCTDCGEEAELNEPTFFCPNCDSPRLEILSGRELTLESIEVEEIDENMEESGNGNQGC